MNRAQEARLYARFALGLPRFLKRRMSSAEARAIVRARLEARETHLAITLRRAVFEHPGSPYLPLLRNAGCEAGDVERLLVADGVEATLRRLFDAGVRISFEEFKGRRPIVRPGVELPTRESDFDNPLVKSGIASGSSGTTGAPSRSYHDLAHILETVPFRLLGAEAHGLLGAPTAMWFVPPPSIAGVNSSLAGVVMDNPPERWFVPTDSEATGDESSLRHRIATQAFFTLAALAGRPLPRPRALPLDRPGELVDWAAGALAQHGRCEIRAFTSTAMRLAREAVARGVDLTGAGIVCGGESSSPAKQRVVEAAGARLISFYAIAECGPIGISCPTAEDSRDLHVSSDRIAILEQATPVGDWNLEVNALFLTSLLPGSPKLMLNVESDDCGTLERRPCRGTSGSGDCGFAEWGLDTHLHDVRSYRRLTAEGVTLVGEWARRAIEESLPQRFGGSPLDFQLRETESENGLSRLELRVSPELGLPPDAEVRSALLAALEPPRASGDGPAEGAVRFWRHAGTIDIVREPPLLTAGGKQLPIVVGGLGQASAARTPAR